MLLTYISGGYGLDAEDLETRGSFAERFRESGIALREILEGACSTPATARPECGT